MMRELSDCHALKAQGEQIPALRRARRGRRCLASPWSCGRRSRPRQPDEHRHGANQREVPHRPEVTAAKDSTGGKCAACDDVCAAAIADAEIGADVLPLQRWVESTTGGGIDASPARSAGAAGVEVWSLPAAIPRRPAAAAWAIRVARAVAERFRVFPRAARPERTLSLCPIPGRRYRRPFPRPAPRTPLSSLFWRTRQELEPTSRPRCTVFNPLQFSPGADSATKRCPGRVRTQVSLT